MSPVPRLRPSSSKALEAHKVQKVQTVGSIASDMNRAARPGLSSLHQMPVWFQLQSNPWILHGYRPISGSMRASASSLLYIHNESMNIYTHLIPAVFVLLGGWHVLQHLASKHPGFTGADSIAFSIFMLAALICLSLSAAYHTLMNHSQRVEHLCLQLDMLGIVILISGDHILEIYMIFWCETLLRYMHWCMVGVFGILTVFVTLNTKLQGQEYRLLRTSAFIAAGMSGAAPFIHGLSVFGMTHVTRKMLRYALVKAACLLSGTFFYATRFPERRYPGYFDLCGSHSIFHILVVCAAVVQMIGYLDALDYSHRSLVCSYR